MRGDCRFDSIRSMTRNRSLRRSVAVISIMRTCYAPKVYMSLKHPAHLDAPFASRVA
jgi:hypothetical protein